MKIKLVTYDYEANQLLVSVESRLDLDKLMDMFQKFIAEDGIRTLDFSLSTLISAGRIIDAIKLHRERTGSSLLAAKNYVDSLRGRS